MSMNRINRFSMVTMLVATFLFAAVSPALAQWEYVGPPSDTHYQVVPDPADVDAATIVTQSRDFYHTADGGASWSQVGSAPTSSIYWYTFHAFDADSFVYYGTDYPNGYINRTEDGGATWAQTVIDTAVVGDFQDLIPHPTDPNIMIGGGYYYDYTNSVMRPYFHKTTNGGATFTSTDLSPAITGRIFGMAASSTDFDLIYAVGTDYDWVAGVNIPVGMKSTDGGVTWSLMTPYSTNAGDTAWTVQIDPSDDNHIMALGNYFWESFDGGATWLQNAVGFVDGKEIFINPTDGANIFIVCYGPTLETKDGGASWTEVPLPDQANWVAWNSGAMSNIWITTWYWGTYKSTDSGATWQSLLTDDFIASDVDTVEVAKSSPERVYASVDGADRLLVSSDSGDTWTPLPSLPLEGHMSGVVESSIDPNLVIASPTGASGDDGEIYRSTDGGNSWTLVCTASDTIYGMVEDPGDSSHFIAYGYGPGTGDKVTWIQDSRDSGVTWTETELWAAGGGSFARLYAFGIYEADNSIMYASGYYRDTNNDYHTEFWKSTDNGLTWSAVTHNLADYEVAYSKALWISPTDPNYVVLGVSGTYSVPVITGVFYSTDGGATWNPSNTIIGDSGDGFAYNPGTGILYMITDGGNGSSVWQSVDQGLNWTSLEGTNGPGRGQCIGIDPKNGRIFVGTGFSKQGVARLDVEVSPLWAQFDELSQSAGGTVDFNVDAGAANAGRYYLILASATGTSPGTALPGGYVTLPLNWDAFTDIALSLVNTVVFANFMGQLDSQGMASAQLFAPPLPAVALGVQMHYAYCCNNYFDYVSNPVRIDIVD